MKKKLLIISIIVVALAFCYTLARIFLPDLFPTRNTFIIENKSAEAIYSPKVYIVSSVPPEEPLLDKKAILLVEFPDIKKGTTEKQIYTEAIENNGNIILLYENEHGETKYLYTEYLPSGSKVSERTFVIE